MFQIKKKFTNKYDYIKMFFEIAEEYQQLFYRPYHISGIIKAKGLMRKVLAFYNENKPNNLNDTYVFT